MQANNSGGSDVINVVMERGATQDFSLTFLFGLKTLSCVSVGFTKFTRSLHIAIGSIFTTTIFVCLQLALRPRTKMLVEPAYAITKNDLCSMATCSCLRSDKAGHWSLKGPGSIGAGASVCPCRVGVHQEAVL
jgi:hypothetical protein